MYIYIYIYAYIHINRLRPEEKISLFINYIFIRNFLHFDMVSLKLVSEGSIHD